MLVILSVCHPVLRVSWFRNIGEDAYNRASALFEHVIRSYEETAPALQASMQVGPKPQAISNNFLASIAQVETQTVAPVTVLKSEFERYVILQEGGDTDLALENPLAWWKVCQFHYHHHLLISHYHLETRS